jgi:hypothetical protein
MSSATTDARRITAHGSRHIYHIRALSAEIEILRIGIDVLQVSPSLAVADPFDVAFQPTQESLVVFHETASRNVSCLLK